MAEHWPALLEIGGPTILRTSDIPGADPLADLLEKTLPPQLQSQKSGDQGQQAQQARTAAAVQAVTDQAGQVIQGLTQRNQELENQIAAKLVQTDTQRYVANLQAETARLIAAAQLGQKEGLALLMSEVQGIKHQLDLEDAQNDRLHQAQQSAAQTQNNAQQDAAQHQADAAKAAQQQQADSQAQQSQQQHEASQATGQQQHEQALATQAQQASLLQSQAVPPAGAPAPPAGASPTGPAA